MDTLAHGLWTNVIFRRQRRANRWWAVFFGVAPDIFSFGPYIVWQILVRGGLPHGRPEPPAYVSVLYNYTHSLVIFFAVFGLVTLLRRGRAWWPLAGWGFHIAIDIGTHTYRFFPTPFLFPIFDWKVSFLSWADSTFMLVNYTFLVLIYAELYRLYRKSKGKIQKDKSGVNVDL